LALLCLTHGEHGPGADGQGLAETRSRELLAAAQVLGVHDVVLLDHGDGMLPWLASSLLEADIQDAILRFRPDVVVTFDEDGLYWHPDHIAVHERTTAAVEGLGERGPALYYVSLPEGAMRAVVESTAGRPGCSDRVLGVADADAFGSMAPEPTLVIEAGPLAVRKLHALRCHESQVAGTALECVEDRDAPRLLGAEHYRRAVVGARGLTFIDQFSAS
jgi:LmbE family N-acetylglucosaminyl deacetylase